MIRIDALWVSVQPMDMRAGADRLLAHVVKVFGSAGMLLLIGLSERESRTVVPIAAVRSLSN